MSMKLVASCWELDLDKTSLVVLMALCDSARDDGTRCYPDVPFLVWKTKVSRAQVFRVLEALEAPGILEQIGMHGRATHYTIHLECAPRKAAYVPPKLGRPRIIQGGPNDKKKSSHHETTFHRDPDPAAIIPSHGETIQSHGETIQSHGETIQSHGETIQSHGETTKRRSDAPQAQARTGATDSKRGSYPVMIPSGTSNDPPEPERPFLKMGSRAEPERPLRWGADGMPMLSARLEVAGVRRLQNKYAWSKVRQEIAHDRPVTFDDWQAMHYWNGKVASENERACEYKRFETAIIARRVMRLAVQSQVEQLTATE